MAKTTQKQSERISSSKKLNSLLCNSFNNVKYDIRHINSQIDALSVNFTNFSTESIKTAFENQTNLILEQKKAINLLTERINMLETIKNTSDSGIMTFHTKESALAEVKKIVRKEKKARNAETGEKSVYDIPEGQVRITNIQFSRKASKGKKSLPEYVEVTGYGVDMTGFSIENKSKRAKYTFPEGFVVYGPVKIFTKKGTDTNTKLYWGRKDIWNPKGDVATLRNKRKKIVSRTLSEPTFSFKELK